MNIDNFMSVANNYANRTPSDDMIVRNGQDGTASSGKLGGKIRRFFRNLFNVGREANARIRQDLAQALSHEYGSTDKIPKNVLQALKLNPDGNMPLDSNGNLKLGSTPLTARRIVAVMDAVNYNRRMAELKTKLTDCFTRNAKPNEAFEADYKNQYKTVKYSVADIVGSTARKMAQTKPGEFSEAKMRTFIDDKFNEVGYLEHGESASFGLSGAAPNKAEKEAIVNDIITMWVKSAARE